MEDIPINLRSETVEFKPRRLRAQWSVEAVADFKRDFGMDAEAHIFAVCVEATRRMNDRWLALMRPWHWAFLHVRGWGGALAALLDVALSGGRRRRGPILRRYCYHTEPFVDWFIPHGSDLTPGEWEDVSRKVHDDVYGNA